MTKQEFSDEQKKVNRLLIRFIKIYNWHILAILVLFAMLIIFPRFLSIKATTLFVISSFLLAGVPIILHWRHREKRFIRSLSDAEMALIESAAGSGGAELREYRQTARELLAARKNYVVHEGKMLLRASALTGDTDMLLRPTSTNEEMDKRELLRTTQ